MATPADAELILKLYDLRRETVMRKARAFVAFAFAPQTADELLAVQRGAGTEENAQWRQVISYWEMAASLCLRGAVDPDLYFDSNGEGIFLLGKFDDLYKGATSAGFMPKTALLVETYPAAKQIYDAVKKRLTTAALSPEVKADQSFNKA